MKKRLELLQKQSSSTFVRTLLQAKEKHNLLSTKGISAKLSAPKHNNLQRQISKSYQDLDLEYENKISSYGEKTAFQIQFKKTLSTILDAQPTSSNHKPVRVSSPKSPGILKDELHFTK
jgi:hypothetical protein